MALDMISPEQVSEQISAIYDCSLDPLRWPNTLAAINDAMDGAYIALNLVNIQREQIVLTTHSPWDPEMIRRVDTYRTEILGSLETFWGPLDTPAGTIADFGVEQFQATRFYREWVQPQGLFDACNVKICEANSRAGMLTFVTRESTGAVTPNNMSLLALLAPHFRRAIMIGDLMEQDRLLLASYQATMDLMASAVILTNDAGQLIEANSAAARYLARSQVLTELNGRLTIADIVSRRAFEQALLRAARGDEEIATWGIGIPLTDGVREHGVCYVLPLNCSSARELRGGASVALFITESVDVLPAPAAVLATLYDLTPAEAFLAVRLSQGIAMEQAALMLRISPNTAKTHLKRVYAKTGVGRQAELVALLSRLTPPARIIGG
jgi:DNA-binding CsgD family transcriptional regulator